MTWQVKYCQRIKRVTRIRHNAYESHSMFTPASRLGSRGSEFVISMTGADTDVLSNNLVLIGNSVCEVTAATAESITVTVGVRFQFVCCSFDTTIGYLFDDCTIDV